VNGGAAFLAGDPAGFLRSHTARRIGEERVFSVTPGSKFGCYKGLGTANVIAAVAQT
jgi:hypothetical protein